MEIAKPKSDFKKESNSSIRAYLKAQMVKIYETISQSHLRYSHLLRMLDIGFYSPKEECLHKAFKFVRHNRINGDYVEFGVHKGHNLVAADYIARSLRLHELKVYGLDSFEGLPSDEGVFSKGQFSVSENEVRAYLKRHKCNARLMSGWFSSHTSLPTKKVAVGYIDCDLYESTTDALKLLLPCVQDGTILIFDDWFSFKGRSDMGEQKAFNEWLLENSHLSVVEYFNFGFHGKAFILNT